MKTDKNYRPYNSSTPIDNGSIMRVTPHPKAWAGDKERWIIDTWDGDSIVCVEVRCQGA